MIRRPLLCLELLIAVSLGLEGAAGQHQHRTSNDTEALDRNGTGQDLIDSLTETETTTFITRSRTTTFTLAPVPSWDNLTGTTTSTTATTTTVFSCPPPTEAGGSSLLQHASCLKRRCEEMSSEVLRMASDGRIGDCFVLLEAAGGCKADATAEVPRLALAQERFEVGDLCGPRCPQSHCMESTSPAATSSSSRPLVPMPTTTTRALEVFQEPESSGPGAEDGPTTREALTSTAAPGTTPDLVATASRLRVVISCLTFRISAPQSFGVQTGIVKALRDGIAASLAVSPAQVNILRVEVPSSEEGKETSDRRSAGLGRRLDAGQASGDVRVPFEILRAPTFLDAQLFMDSDTTTSMEVHLSQLFVAAGVVGTISDLRLKEPEVVFREVTKKETSVNEWFFTYPVDTKIDRMEPLEPGLASAGGRPAAILAWSAGLLGFVFLL